MDTDDMPSQVQNASAPPPPTYELPPALNNSASNVMVTIPYGPGTEIVDNQPYSFSIAGAENGATMSSAYGSDMATAKSKANHDELIIEPKTVPADRQYMIKIENNDGTSPYPLSITLPHHMNPTENSDAGKMATVVAHPTNGLIQSNQMQINGERRSLHGRARIARPTILRTHLINGQSFSCILSRAQELQVK